MFESKYFSIYSIDFSGKGLDISIFSIEYYEIFWIRKWKTNWYLISPSSFSRKNPQTKRLNSENILQLMRRIILYIFNKEIFIKTTQNQVPWKFFFIFRNYWEVSIQFTPESIYGADYKWNDPMKTFWIQVISWSSRKISIQWRNTSFQQWVLYLGLRCVWIMIGWII